jgi:hypothetical protein
VYQSFNGFEGITRKHENQISVNPSMTFFVTASQNDQKYCPVWIC